MSTAPLRWSAVAAVGLLVLAGCQPAAPSRSAGAPGTAPVSGPSSGDPGPSPSPASAVSAPSPAPPVAVQRPAWLGTRILPLRPDGFGEVRRTPGILRNRSFLTADILPPPPEGHFAATVRRVRPAIAGRSTWSAACPVTLDQLRYVTVTFRGFDERPHTGELLVNRDVARDTVRVFRRLYRTGFPIEEMRIVTRAELDAPPTGDGNNTTSFVCRPSRGSTRWSQHAYGLAIDVNPFHNPYVRDDLVLPELAGAYTQRDRVRRGMVLPDGPVVAAFDAIGWGWGGRWSRPVDWMHFSANGT